jgi:curli production assembly/transport component CsgG
MKLADAKLNPVTVTEHTLKWLPGPTSRIPIAVYGVADQTGSFKQSDGGQNLSRAVTQAPTPILIKALQDAGNRRWFSVIERENLQNILRERQIILDMRKRYLGETELNREALPALKFAGVLIEGAITGYDTNTVTGGAGARYLGIGGSTQYREDAVSVYLRAVSVKTGEVLISISSEQRVASVAAQGNAFRFVAFQELLEAEAGLTLNQPRHLAVRQAFEKAVYGMIVEGAELGLWEFGDDQAGHAAIAHYRSTYARAPKDKFAGILPDAFYAARQRDIQRMQTAANAARRQSASLTQQIPQRANVAPAPRRQAPGSAAPAATVNVAKASLPAPRRDARQVPAKPVTEPVTEKVRAPKPQQPQIVQQQVASVAARQEPVVRQSKLNQPVAKQEAHVVKTTPPTLINQTLADAYQAVEVSLQSSELETQTASAVLSDEAIQNLLRSQTAQGLDARSRLLLANASEDTRSSVVISEHKEVAPPPP